jgi:hypothetical protein
MDMDRKSLLPAQTFAPETVVLGHRRSLPGICPLPALGSRLLDRYRRC